MAQPMMDQPMISTRLATAMEQLEQDPAAALEKLDALYAETMTFTDPLQTISGRTAFIAMNRRLINRFRKLRIQVLDTAESERGIFLLWRMEAATRFGANLTIEGITHCRVENGLIVDQRDYWDLLGSALASIPVAGSVYRRFTKMFA